MRLPQFITGGKEQDRLHLDGYAVSQSALSLGPGFTNVMQAGPNLILQGTNGPPEGAFSVLRSANLMQPLDNWLLAGLDNFDSNGNFSFTNPLPAIPASFYTLRVLSAVAVPDIIGQPGDELVFPGQTATFTVVADGAPPLHYQWYYNTNTILAGETNSTLALTNVQFSDEGMYSVVVTNHFGGATSAFSSLTLITNSAVAGPDGYATQNIGTTGGGNATPVTVSTASAFRAVVGGSTPAVIIVDGRLDLGGDVTIGANKTILGADTSAGLFNGTVKVQSPNCILQNLIIGPPDTGDAMEISGANNVFIHKCTIHDSTDELCSIVRGGDYVTVSWSKFYFDNPNGHSFAHLIGSSDGATGDIGKLHVTLHHNWYAQGVRGRVPRVRFGRVHVYNNYFNSPGNGYCVSSRYEAQVLLENSYFENVNNPWDKEQTGLLKTSGNVTVNTSGSASPSNDPVFTPPYSYTLQSAADARAGVLVGAGNTF